MNTTELPLVFFTIMAQMSVGCFLVLGIIHLTAGRRLGTTRVDRISDPALYAIGPVMVAALIVSILHLGNPINALNTITGLRTSWLSREILTGSTFAGLGAVFALCQWRKWLTPLLRQTLAGLTALVGLLLLTSMSMVYMLPTIPSWNTWATPISFTTTTLLLGALAVGTALVSVLAWTRHHHTPLDQDLTALIRGSLRGIAIASIALLGVEFVALPTYILQLSQTNGTPAQDTINTLLYGHGTILIIRLILVFTGAGLLGLLLHHMATTGQQKTMRYTILSAFTLVLASELIGRLLFYSSHFRIGI